jgi:acyl-CoA thioesterase I
MLVCAIILNRQPDKKMQTAFVRKLLCFMQQFTIKTQARQKLRKSAKHTPDFCHTRASRPSRRLFLPLLVSLVFLLLAGCSQTPVQDAGQGSGQQATSQLPTYVAIGASDTFGIGTANPYTQNWPSDLTDLISLQAHTQFRLVNLGIPGMTIHTALTTELPIALTAHPRLITIWLAVNDLATNVTVSDYSRDLNTLLSRLQTAAPNAQIEVGNMPDLTSVPFFRTYNQTTLRQQIAAYNQAIDSIVHNHHVLLVDLSGQGYNLQEFPEYISNDGLHPSVTGYLQLATLFYAALHQS